MYSLWHNLQLIEGGQYKELVLFWRKTCLKIVYTDQNISYNLKQSWQLADKFMHVLYLITDEFKGENQ
jgi:hypothetical protein